MVLQTQPTTTAEALCNQRDRRALWRMRGRCSACCWVVCPSLQGGFSPISRLQLPAAPGTVATWIRCIAKWKSWSEIFTAVKGAHWNWLTLSPEIVTIMLFIFKPQEQWNVWHFVVGHNIGVNTIYSAMIWGYLSYYFQNCSYFFDAVSNLGRLR